MLRVMLTGCLIGAVVVMALSFSSAFAFESSLDLGDPRPIRMVLFVWVGIAFYVGMWIGGL